MTTAELDVFFGDDEKPSAWYEISHDGYPDADGGFLDFLKTTLQETPNPPKTLDAFVHMLDVPLIGGWPWRSFDMDSVDKFKNLNLGPYTVAEDGDWKKSACYAYRIRLRGGKWTIDCDDFHTAVYKADTRRLRRKGLKALKSGEPALSGNPYRTVWDSIGDDCRKRLFMHDGEICEFIHGILVEAGVERPPAVEEETNVETKGNDKMTITLDGSKKEITEFMEAMAKAGYDGTVHTAAPGQPADESKPKAGKPKAKRGRPRRADGMTEKAMEMIGEKKTAKFSELNAGKRRSYWRAVKYLGGKTKSFKA